MVVVERGWRITRRQGALGVSVRFCSTIPQRKIHRRTTTTSQRADYATNQVEIRSKLRGLFTAVRKGEWIYSGLMIRSHMPTTTVPWSWRRLSRFVAMVFSFSLCHRWRSKKMHSLPRYFSVFALVWFISHICRAPSFEWKERSDTIGLPSFSL